MITRTLGTLAVGLVATALGAADAQAHSQLRATGSFASRSLLQSTLNSLTNSGTDIDEMATSASGQWVIVAGGTLYSSSGAPSGLRSRIQQFINAGRTVDAVIMGPSGSWAVAAQDLWARSSNLPNLSAIQNWYNKQRSAGRRVTEMTLTPQGGFVLIAGTRYKMKNAGNGLAEAIRDRNRSRRRITSISVGADGRWLVLATQALASRGLNSTTMNRIRSWQRSGNSLDHVVLGVGNDHVLYSHQSNVASAQSATLDAIEYQLGTGGNTSVWQRMQDLNIPGLSIAIIRNGQLQEARGYGLLDAADRDRWVTARSPFAVASLAKYVTSLGLARVIDSGDLNWLDDASTLTGPRLSLWRFIQSQQGQSALPAGMTMARMMRHEAGMSDGWGGYDSRNATPKTTLQVLTDTPCSGVPCTLSGTVWHDPANGMPTVRTLQYANTHYEVIRAAMEDARADDFADIMADEVFGPLGMEDSSYVQPLPSDLHDRAALGHDINGVSQLSRPTYQWTASGGLYSTPRDYARAMLVLMDVANANATGYLSAAQTNVLRTDVTRYAGEAFRSAAQMTASPADGPNTAFCHGGWLPDLAFSHMYGSPATGDGIVVFTNAEGGNAIRAEIRNAFRGALPTVPPSCN